MIVFILDFGYSGARVCPWQKGMKMANSGIKIIPGNKENYIGALRKREAAAERELNTIRAQITSFLESQSTNAETKLS